MGTRETPAGVKFVATWLAIWFGLNVLISLPRVFELIEARTHEALVFATLVAMLPIGMILKHRILARQKREHEQKLQARARLRAERLSRMERPVAPPEG